MKGNETFKVAVRTLENLVSRTLEENKLKASQISLLIPHQANLRIIQATAERPVFRWKRSLSILINMGTPLPPLFYCA